MPLTAAALPPGAPAEAWAHLALYRARGDAGAIARAQPPGRFAAAAVTTALPALHGQAAWLGASVPVHDSALPAALGRPGRAAAASGLPDGEALLLRGNGALTLGATPGIAVARMWLLSAACDVFLAARAAGPVQPLSAAGDRVVARGPGRAAAPAVAAPEPPRRGGDVSSGAGGPHVLMALRSRWR